MLRELSRPLLHEILEVVPVGLQLPLDPLPFRDVLEEGDEVVHGPVRRTDAADREVGRDHGPVLSQEALLERVAVDFSADNALEPRDVPREVVRMSQLRPGSSQELFPRVPKDRAKPVVHLEPPLRRRRDAGPDQGHLEVAPESLLGLPQPRLRRPPFRDVLDGSGPDRVAVLVNPRKGLPPDPPDLSSDGEPPFPAERTVMGKRLGVRRRETLPIRRHDEVRDAPGVRAKGRSVDGEDLAETRRHEPDLVSLVDGGSPGPGLHRRRREDAEPVDPTGLSLDEVLVEGALLAERFLRLARVSSAGRTIRIRHRHGALSFLSGRAHSVTDGP